MKIILGIIFLIVIGLLGYSYYRGGFPFHPEQPIQDSKTESSSPSSIPSLSTKTPSYKIETVASGLFVPWSMVFTSSDRILVTERNGNIREIVSGNLNPNPLYVFKEVSPKGEAGLMSIGLSPEYKSDKLVYVCVSYAKNNKLVNKVAKLKDEGDTLAVDKIIRDDIPAASSHAGCAVRFGPDKMLYVTTGDATDKNLSQDKNSLAGKILRMDKDGGIPTDNPFPESYIYAYGLRNTQGLDWNPQNGEIYAVDHGPSGFDGPGGGDEINHIKKGHNYGWPLVSHEETREGTVPPLVQYTPAIAPASLVFYTGDAFPDFKNNAFVGMLKGEGILRIIFSESDPDKIIYKEKLPEVSVGRVRDVIEGPDGYIYFTTSNRDGRGTVQSGDDKVYRIVPN